jgi:hypothetical protein
MGLGFGEFVVDVLPICPTAWAGKAMKSLVSGQNAIPIAAFAECLTDRILFCPRKGAGEGVETAHIQR